MICSQVPQLQSRVESLTSELEILEKSLQHEFDLIRKLKEKADQELQPEVIRLGKMKETVEVMKVGFKESRSGQLETS